MKSIAPAIDFTVQLNFANYENVESIILNILKKIAKDINDGKSNGIGAIVVLGTWSSSNPIVEDMLQLKPAVSPIDKFITIDLIEDVSVLQNFFASSFDGAVVINTLGQVLGAGVYLVVEYPMIEIPKGCGTRHKAAASFSCKKDVISVLTLSEETNIIRIWKNGECEIAT